MRHIMKVLYLGLFMLLAFGCAGSYSVREHNMISQIPEEQRIYKEGIIIFPTDEDIKRAIDFGAASKDSDVLEYAYLKKVPGDLFDDDTIYFKISTPLYYISNHAKKQAREYRQIDYRYIEYIRGLRAAKISLTQQYTGAATLRQYAFQRRIILLRDGIRVEPLKEVVTYSGQHPFSDTLAINTQAIMAKVAQTSSQYTKGYFATMNSEQKTRLIQTYRANGLTEDQISSMTGLETDEIGRLSPRTNAAQDTKMDGNKETKITLSELDAIFSIEELKKPGIYEVVFRTPPSNSMFTSGDKEIRFPITFDNFK